LRNPHLRVLVNKDERRSDENRPKIRTGRAMGLVCRARSTEHTKSYKSDQQILAPSTGQNAKTCELY
jgi:hypothetical protein